MAHATAAITNETPMTTDRVIFMERYQTTTHAYRHAAVRMSIFRSKTGAIGAGFYLLTFLCACLYPLFDRKTFSGLVPVLLAWPWIDYFPSSLLLLAVFLNVVIIYFMLASLSLLMAVLWALGKKNPPG